MTQAGSAFWAFLCAALAILGSVGSAQGAPVDLAELKSQTRYGLVYLTATDGGPSAVNTVVGTAVLLSNQGLVVTDYHVISGWYELLPAQQSVRPIEARLGSINGLSLGSVAVVAVDKASDVAVLKIAVPVAARPLPICFKTALLEEHQIYAAGFADGHQLNIIPGRYTNDGRTTPRSSSDGDSTNDNPAHFWEVTSTFAGGMSGGPVFDEWGSVVGLVEGGVADSQATKFVIPLARVRDLLTAFGHIPQDCRTAIEGGSPDIIPTIEIFNGGATIPAGYKFRLHGKAFDPRTGPLSGDALTWVVDGRTADKGDDLELPDLAVGAHVVGLKATSIEGRYNETTVAATVTTSVPALKKLASNDSTACSAIALQGGIVAVGTTTDMAGAVPSVNLLELSQHATLEAKGEIASVGAPLDYPIAMAGKNLFVRVMGNGVQQFDVSDPVHALLMHTFQVPISLSGPTSYSVSENQLIAKTGTSISVFDLTGSQGIRVPSYTIPGRVVEMGAGFGVDNSVFVLPHRYLDLEIMRRGADASPRVLATLHLPEDQLSTNVLFSRKVAFVGSWSGTLDAISLSEPSHPQVLGRLKGAGNAFRIGLWGDYVFLAGMRDGLIIVDVHDPKSMHVVGANGSVGSVSDLAIDGDKIAICSDQGASLFSMAGR